MIIQQVSSADMRTVRVKLYKDPVFLIAHEAVRPLLKSTDLVTLFVSAQNFAAYLMANGIMDEEFLLYELEDVRSELTEHEDYYMFLSIVFIKLCSVAKFNAQAAQTARAIVGYCNEYDGFCDMLKAMDYKENKLRGENKLNYLPKGEVSFAEGKRNDLLRFELEHAAAESKEAVREIVETAKEMDVECIKSILFVLGKLNVAHGNMYDSEYNDLYDVYVKKTQVVYNFKSLNDIHDNQEVKIGK